MSDEKPAARSSKETINLHLGKFAHGTPAPSESVPAAEEGPTLIIRRAAVETVASHAEPVIVPGCAAPLSPEELLGAVAYCYAKGVFSSAEIERKMLADPEFRAALGGMVPDPEALRKFRQLNREAIQEVLEKFYRRYREQREITGNAPPDGGQSSGATSPKSHDLRQTDEGTTTTEVKRDAQDLLDVATFVDPMLGSS